MLWCFVWNHAQTQNGEIFSRKEFRRYPHARSALTACSYRVCDSYNNIYKKKKIWCSPDPNSVGSHCQKLSLITYTKAARSSMCFISRRHETNPKAILKRVKMGSKLSTRALSILLGLTSLLLFSSWYTFDSSNFKFLYGHWVAEFVSGFALLKPLSPWLFFEIKNTLYFKLGLTANYSSTALGPRLNFFLSFMGKWGWGRLFLYQNLQFKRTLQQKNSFVK